MNQNPYKDLAERLNSTPNGFPPTDDGTELRLLEKLYTPQEAEIASQLRLTPESIEQISNRLDTSDTQFKDVKELKTQLKQMARNGLIAVDRTARSGRA